MPLSDVLPLRYLRAYIIDSISFRRRQCYRDTHIQEEEISEITVHISSTSYYPEEVKAIETPLSEQDALRDFRATIISFVPSMKTIAPLRCPSRTYLYLRTLHAHILSLSIPNSPTTIEIPLNQNDFSSSQTTLSP